MTLVESTEGPGRRDSIEWRLYHTMLVTRLFEEALLRWEREGKTCPLYWFIGQPRCLIDS